MKDFTFQFPTKILFGEGQSIRLPELCSSFSAKKVFIITGKYVSQTMAFSNLTAALENAGIESVIYKDTIPEPPVEKVDETAQILKSSHCSLVIAVGGGSVIDTAKAVCMLQTNEGSIRDYLFGGHKKVSKRPLPFICVPTTAGSGSEVTASSVISDIQNQIKLSVTHEFLIPSTAVIDPLMYLDMPPLVTASTGMDALTHAVEAYVSLNSNPISDGYALQSMNLISKYLLTTVRHPLDLEARGSMALASMMAAGAFVSAGLGAVHGISQALGGISHISHGMANSLILPYVCEKNAAGNPIKFAKIAEIFGYDTSLPADKEKPLAAADAIKKLSQNLGIPKGLSEYGITKDMFPAVISGAMAYRMMALNPVKLTEQDILDILEHAF